MRRTKIIDGLPHPSAPYLYDPDTEAWVPERAIRQVELGDSASRDAFSRQRVASPTALLAQELEYDSSPLYWYEVLSGGGTATHSYADAAVILEVSSTNDAVVRQSKKYVRYQPGKSQLVVLTALVGQSAGARRRVGAFDADNGIFLEVLGDEVAWVIRKNGVDTRVAQAAWNIDPLDSTGPSGHLLDMNKAQIVHIDFQWLGVGRVRVGFDIDGNIHYVHEFLHANVVTGVYMRTANLPVRYEITALDLDQEATDLYQICSTVISEGGFEGVAGTPFSASTAAVTSVNALTPLISIRPKATFNGHVNRGQIVPTIAGLLSDDQNAELRLIYGGTLTNPSWASVDAASIVEVDEAATAVSGGIPIESTLVPASASGAVTRPGAVRSQLLGNIVLALDIGAAHPTMPYTDILTLAARTLPAAASDAWGTLAWTEVR